MHSAHVFCKEMQHKLMLVTMLFTVLLTLLVLVALLWTLTCFISVFTLFLFCLYQMPAKVLLVLSGYFHFTHVALTSLPSSWSKDQSTQIWHHTNGSCVIVGTLTIGSCSRTLWGIKGVFCRSSGGIVHRSDIVVRGYRRSLVN